MAAANWFRYVYRAHFSKPKTLRPLYKLIRRHKVSRIVEIGIADLQRSVSLIEVAQRFAENGKVCHASLDAFDARPDGLAPLSIRDAYRALQATGAAVRLVPGPPAGALGSVANALQHTDLVLISAGVSDVDLQNAWFYVPRMLHQRSAVFREQRNADEPSFQWLTHSQIAEWAGQFGSRRAA